MVIITGMDNSGKTTLANQVANNLKTNLVKSPGPNYSKSEKDDWIKSQIDFDRESLEYRVYDRFIPFEEMVYGRVLRGDPLYSLDDKLMKELRSINPTIVYTRPPTEVIFNFGEREQMEGVIETKEKLLAAWDNLMWRMLAMGWDIQPYDYTIKEE